MERIILCPSGYEKIVEPYHNINFLLLHVAMKSENYINFFAQSKKYKILDNSYYELRELMPNDTILEYAKKMKVQEIISPDVMYNCDATIEATKSFIDVCPKKYKIQGVVCGETSIDLRRCFNWMNKCRDIDVIAFSKHGQMIPTDDYYYNRYKLVWKLAEKTKKPIHLLGANGINTWLSEWPNNVRSCDSNIMIKLANKNKSGWFIKLPKESIERLNHLSYYINTLDSDDW